MNVHISGVVKNVKLNAPAVSSKHSEGFAKIDGCIGDERLCVWARNTRSAPFELIFFSARRELCELLYVQQLRADSAFRKQELTHVRNHPFKFEE